MIRRVKRGHAILILIIVALIIPSMIILIPLVLDFETKRLNIILLTTVPTHVNLTIEGNNTISKRIGLSFSDVVTLLPPKMEVPPGIDRNLTFIYNSSTPTTEYFVYVVGNNSKYIFPEGTYEGTIRFYYKDYKDQTGFVLNKAIPIDVNVVNNTKKR
jgi:hypothetical protein